MGLRKSRSRRSSASIRNSKPAFKLAEIGKNPNPEGTVSTTSYTKVWNRISDAELKRIMQTVKRMEKGKWVVDSMLESDETMGRKHNVKWTYKVIR